MTAGTAQAPAWSPGGPAATVLTGGVGPDDEVSDVVPVRRRGRIVQITIAAAGVLAVAVAMVALAAHGHPFGLMATLTGSGDPGYSVAFSPDGHTLAAGTNLWDAAARHQIATLTDPGVISVKAAAFSPDGHTLATGDYNGSTYLWDVATGHRIATLTDPNSLGVSSVAFSPDGHTLATDDIDGAYLWSVR